VVNLPHNRTCGAASLVERETMCGCPHLEILHDMK
jgi:hypothetical protein